ncbi:hypothetical protein [Paracoccus sp. (in: a-proteobacteria)]|uniref:hypothetical protein n=1 Tax=Paracoccus sp. TaxID=267 RepID=UPI0026E0D8E5|nr:hypothetical protein [Paracoccus sp. (in: a-proteobacteria)]MDO5647291.1 hypothetical protein [Paracoccus sp. (in: a-proteobacteria)]
MTRLLTNHICTITELREPHKVLERAGGKPVAILKNSQLVGYLVPEQATEPQARALTRDEVQALLDQSRADVQPVLDYLQDK